MKKYNFNEKELFDLFVNKDDMAIPITTLKPYRRDGYVYATDCKKLIRVRDSVISGEYEATDEMALEWPENNCCYTITDNDIQKVLSEIPQEEETEVVGRNVKCPECDGDGTVWWEYRDKKSETHEAEHDCPVCDGSGYVEKEKTRKTGRMIPNPRQIIQVGKNKIISCYLKTLLDAMGIVGVSETRLVCQTEVFNHFKIDDNISIMFASNSLDADYEMQLSGYNDLRKTTMKTPEQIKQWLQAQPWYDEFREKVMDGNDISYNSKMNILNGKRGVYTIHEAIGSPDYDSEKWWVRINEFSLWFCSNETIIFDIMLGGRFVCTMRMPFCPLFPLTTEEIQSFVESKRPSLRGKDYKIAF